MWYKANTNANYPQDNILYLGVIHKLIYQYRYNQRLFTLLLLVKLENQMNWIVTRELDISVNICSTIVEEENENIFFKSY